MLATTPSAFKRASCMLRMAAAGSIALRSAELAPAALSACISASRPSAEPFKHKHTGTTGIYTREEMGRLDRAQ